MKEAKLDNIIKELSDVNKKREKELLEMDRIAKMLIRRDLELNEIREKREKELVELKESKSALQDMLSVVQEAGKKAEMERDKTLAIFNNFTDGLLLFDKNNNLDSINPQAESFLNIKGKDVIGKSALALLRVLGFESLVNLLGEEIQSSFKKQIELKKDLFLEISSVVIAAGQEKWGTLIILHDITRDKAIEKTKTEFVSVAAHQLRTPLSAIKWTLKMLLDGDLGKINDEQKEYVLKAYKTNEVMINLINDLLNVARIEEGRYLYSPVLVSLEDIIQSVVDFCQDDAARKGVRLLFTRSNKRSVKVLVDVEKIKLAVQNLLENAVKYTLAGGNVETALKYQPERVEVSVKDSGIGIPTDQQDRIFSKFFRAVSAVRLETEGSGLGLFITKNIIEAHNGKIWFESREGKGTTFYFTLPVKTRMEEFLMNL